MKKTTSSPVFNAITQIRRIQERENPDELTVDPFDSDIPEVRAILDSLTTAPHLKAIEEWSFDRHLMNPSASRFAERLLHDVRECVAAADTSGATYTLLREDDNGARFEIQTGLSKAVAESRLRELLHHAHKQHYWLEADNN